MVKIDVRLLCQPHCRENGVAGVDKTIHAPRDDAERLEGFVTGVLVGEDAGHGSNENSSRSVRGLAMNVRTRRTPPTLTDEATGLAGPQR